MYFILIIWGCFLIFPNVAALISVLAWGQKSLNRVSVLIFIQLSSSIGTFLIPALWLQRMKKAKFPDYLKLRKGFSGKDLIFFLLAFVLLLPAIAFLQDLTGTWNLEHSPVSLLRWFHEKSTAAEILTEKMLHVSSWSLFAFSLLTVGFCAGICEEFLFRGGLQNLLKEWFGEPHSAIWTTAFIFSLVHLDLYGFLPRLLLGALLGYAYYLGDSIWIPVLLHVLNNSATALLEFLAFNGKIGIDPNYILGKNPLWAILVGILIVFLYKKKKATVHADKQ